MIGKIAVTTAAAALSVVIAASGAGAAAGSYYFDGTESVNPGTGTASADYSSDAFGRLSADSSATGGSRGGLLGGTKTTSASAEGRVTDGFAVTQGTYQVTVTFTGARAVEQATGNGAATGVVVGTATLATAYFETIVLGTGTADLTGTAQTVSVSFQISVQNDSQVGVQAELQSSASAKGRQSAASTAADTTGVTFSIQKTG